VAAKGSATLKSGGEGASLVTGTLLPIGLRRDRSGAKRWNSVEVRWHEKEQALHDDRHRDRASVMATKRKPGIT